MPGEGCMCVWEGYRALSLSATPTPRRKGCTVLGLPADRAVRPVLLLLPAGSDETWACTTGTLDSPRLEDGAFLTQTRYSVCDFKGD